MDQDRKALAEPDDVVARNQSDKPAIILIAPTL
eukprot:CAMPEP_0119023778 /NCGR_PEP_ID=MMETSP1176-20130426/30622_1 /TAXON_ID=265551 /ORGANISM="Synedropsis recta cf, Strain CCMP1620" /LENGTH=32 /DNA_ID= /DNA_START= /DNA_END= /DNA_ORIENTATION=